MMKMTTQREELDALAAALSDLADAQDEPADADTPAYPCPVCAGPTQCCVDDPPVVLHRCPQHGAFLMPD